MTCLSFMLLPPQEAGRRILCQLPEHGDEILHQAEDVDGIMRRWPSSGQAAAAAGAGVVMLPSTRPVGGGGDRIGS